MDNNEQKPAPNLKDTLMNIEKYMAAQKEQGKEVTVKKWSPPMFKTRLGKKKKRSGWCIFQILGENNSVRFVKAKMDENVVMLDDTPHYVSTEDILFYKNKLPWVIVPQWSERAFSAKAHHDLVNQKGQGSMGYRFIMNYLHKNMITEKKKVGMGLIILGIIVIGGLGYYMFKSGAFS